MARWEVNKASACLFLKDDLQIIFKAFNLWHEKIETIKVQIIIVGLIQMANLLLMFNKLFLLT